MPPYTEVPFGHLGAGLNIRDKSDAVEEEQAIDAYNVTYTEQGAVRQRDGYAALSGTLDNRVGSLEPYYEIDGTKQLLAGCGTKLEALDATGGVVSSVSGLTDGIWDFARFGGPTAEVAYAGNGKQTLRKWDGANWSTVANSPQARYLCVLPVSNRLVATGFDAGSGGPSGATVNPSRVHLSDEGAPETWTSTNYFDFDPGDGEAVQGAITWGDKVFVFKETKFCVLYGESTDAAGVTDFLVYTVDARYGLASPRALAAHRTGVYYMSREGVYRTTGQEPELLSDLVSPIWTGDVADYYLGGTLSHSNITNCSAAFHGEQFILSFPTTSENNRQLVYDPRYEWWSLWDLPASCMASFRIGSQAELVFGYSGQSVEKRVGRINTSQTSDAGAAITSRWRSGWFDHGEPAQKTVRQVKSWGSGVVTVGIAVDYNLAAQTFSVATMASTADLWGDGTGTDLWGDGTGTDTWGPKGGVLKPALACRNGARGTTFSVLLSNSTLNQGWAVHRFAQHLRDIRRPSVIRTS